MKKIMLMLLVLGLVGCSLSDDGLDKKFIGEWLDTELGIDFVTIKPSVGEEVEIIVRRYKKTRTFIGKISLEGQAITLKGRTMTINSEGLLVFRGNTYEKTTK